MKRPHGSDPVGLFLCPKEVSKCPSDHSDPALIPAAPTSVKDSFVNSTVWRNAAGMINTNAVQTSIKSTAERGNASATVTLRSIRFARGALMRNG